MIKCKKCKTNNREKSLFTYTRVKKLNFKKIKKLKIKIKNKNKTNSKLLMVFFFGQKTHLLLGSLVGLLEKGIHGKANVGCEIGNSGNIGMRQDLADPSNFPTFRKVFSDRHANVF